jgi:hypothetical protein
MSESERSESRRLLIEEIRCSIDYLITTKDLSDADKVAIARTVLNIIETGQGEIVL